MAIIPLPFVSEPQKSQGIMSPCYTEGGGLCKLGAGHRLHVLAGGRGGLGRACGMGKYRCGHFRRAACAPQPLRANGFHALGLSLQRDSKGCDPVSGEFGSGGWSRARAQGPHSYLAAAVLLFCQFKPFFFNVCFPLS